MDLWTLTQQGSVLLEGKTRWFRPNTKSRQGEFNEITRTSRSLDIPLEKLVDAVEHGKLGPLTRAQWRVLKNSHSFGITEKAAREHAKRKGRNIDRIYDALKTGEPLPAPIVLHRAGHRPYLMAGNHRLMASYTRGIHPDVLHVYLD